MTNLDSKPLEDSMARQGDEPSAAMLDEDEINLLDYWRVIQPSWRTIVAITLSVAFISGVYSFIAIPRKWEATTRVLLPQQLQGAGVGQILALPGAGGAGGGLAGLIGGGPNLADTYKAILESDTIRESMAHEFHFDKIFRLNTREQLLGAVQGMITMTSDPKSGLISIAATVGGTPQGAISRRGDHSRWGIDDIEARELTAALANRSLQLVQDYLRKSNIFQSQKYRQYIERQTEETLAELTLARGRLQGFQQGEKTISPSDEMRSLLTTLQDLEQQKTLADISVKQSQSQIATVSKQLKAQARMPLAIPAESPVMQHWRQELIEQEAELSIMQKEFTDSHPDVVRLRAEIGETKRQLRLEVNRVLAATQSGLAPQLTDLVVKKIATESQSGGLSAAISRLQSKKASLPPRLMTFSQLQGDVEVVERRYRLLTEELERARMAEAKEPTGFVILDRAVPPTKKSGPSNTKNVMLATMIGFMVAVLGVFIRHRANSDQQ